MANPTSEIDPIIESCLQAGYKALRRLPPEYRKDVASAMKMLFEAGRLAGYAEGLRSQASSKRTTPAGRAAREKSVQDRMYQLLNPEFEQSE